MASASFEGEREGDVRNITRGKGGKKERRAGRRVGPAAALRWPAGAGRRSSMEVQGHGFRFLRRRERGGCEK